MKKEKKTDVLSLDERLESCSLRLAELHKIKESLVYNDLSYQDVKIIDNEIDGCLEEINELADRMRKEEYQCSCDGVESACSSKMCNYRYTHMKGFPSPFNIEDTSAEGLKKELSILENEKTMLSDTIEEVEYRGGSPEVLYDEMKKKESEIELIKKLMDKGKCCKESETEISTAPIMSEMTEQLKDVCKMADSAMRQNRFLVEMPVFPDTAIRSVMFNTAEQTITLECYEIVKEGSEPIVWTLHKWFADSKQIDSITIKRLNNLNEVAFTEKYLHCLLISYDRVPLEYASDELSRVYLTFSYKEFVTQ